MNAESKYLALWGIQEGLGYRAPGFPLEPRPLIIRAQINYNFIDTILLDALEQLSIPVRSTLPFAADWYDVVRKLANNGKEQAASWIATLVYSEWSIMYWWANFEDQGILSRVTLKTRKDEFVRNNFIREQLPIGDSISLGSSPVDLIDKWWLDDLALKLRAVWDKIPHAIAESGHIKDKLKSNTHVKRLNELRDKITNGRLGLSIRGQISLQKLINEAKNIELVREHRNGEVHGHTKRYPEVFGVYGIHSTMGEVWTVLDKELNRCREALMATIGLILAQNDH